MLINIQKQICYVINTGRRKCLARDWQPFLRKSREEAECNQLNRLKKLLIHAGKYVPYYRDCFKKIGFDPYDIKNISELEKLPVLTKDIVRREGKRMLAENFSTTELMPKYTGGSTGEPLSFYRHKEYLKASQMGSYRNMSICGWKPGEPIANFWGIPEADSSPWHAFKEEVNLGIYTFNSFNANPKFFTDWLDRLEKIKPVVVYGYAAFIYLFCRWLDDKSASLKAFNNLKGVLTTADVLHPFQRELIQKVLNVPVFNLYGSTEIQNTAFECLQGGMHISSDFVVLESENTSSGKDTLLLTSLHNYAMPFIRYRNGDEGRILGYSCDCGIPAPCMDLEISRSNDNVITASGRIIHNQFFIAAIFSVKGISLFQYRQLSPGSMKLLVVADEYCNEDTKKQVSEIPSVIARRCDDEIKVEVEWVDSIPTTNRGKHLFIVSDIGKASLGQ